MNPRAPWTRARILSTIRKEARAGRSLKINDLRSRGLGSLRVAADKYLGGWRRARRLAGVPMAPGRTWTRKRILETIRKEARAGRSFRKRDLEARGLGGLIAAAKTYLGSLRRACDLAGVKSPPKKEYKRKWSRKRILAVIRAEGRADRSLVTRHLEARGLGSLPAVAKTYVGSWRRARRLAGFPMG